MKRDATDRANVSHHRVTDSSASRWRTVVAARAAAAASTSATAAAVDRELPDQHRTEVRRGQRRRRLRRTILAIGTAAADVNKISTDRKEADEAEVAS